ncbi:hypothetical protein K438DRAFT_1780553 [Mycena galopus ATCC 62051]|nr:hypothetical protein K438DRAFT_1780553 [Mycena galopus ATCC 62051]
MSHTCVKPDPSNIIVGNWGQNSSTILKLTGGPILHVDLSISTPSAPSQDNEVEDGLGRSCEQEKETFINVDLPISILDQQVRNLTRFFNLQHNGLIRMCKVNILKLKALSNTSNHPGDIRIACDTWQADNLDTYCVATGSFIEVTDGVWRKHTVMLGFVCLQIAP